MLRLLSVLALCGIASGTVRYVGTGQTYTTVAAAMAIHQKGDTIMVLNTTNEIANIDSWPTPVYLRSRDMDRLDTIYIHNGETGITVNDSVEIEGLTISYKPDASYSGFGQLMQINGNINHLKIKNCNLLSGGGNYKYNHAAFRWQFDGFAQPKRTVNYTYPIKIDSCYLDSVGSRSYTAGMKLTNSILNGCQLAIGSGCFVAYNQIERNGGLKCKGDSSYFGYNYLRESGGSGWDLSETNLRARNWAIEFNVFDGSNYVPMSIDGLQNSVVCNNRFTRVVRGQASFNIYTHSDVNDTVSNVVFSNNSFWTDGISGYNLKSSSNPGIKSKLEAFVNVKSFGSLRSASDTLDSCFTSVSIPRDSFSLFRDTIYRANASMFFTDSLYMFHKYGSPGVFSNGRFTGWTKYLTNYKQTAFNIGYYSFSVNCSLSNDCWYKNPMKKDSAKVKLLISPNSSGPWSTADSSVLLAGKTNIYTAKNLTSNTKYYYMLSSQGINTQIQINDTTYVSNILTNGGSVEVPPSSTGKKLYVSPSGSDAVTYTNNDISHPWATPLNAWTYAKAGDTVFFRAGTYVITSQIWTKYFGNNGTIDKPIVFTASPNESVLFRNNSLTMTPFIIEKSYNTVQNINFYGGATWFKIGYDKLMNNFSVKNCNVVLTAGGDNTGFVYANGGSSYVTVYNCKIRGAGLRANGFHNNTACVIAFNSANLIVRKCEFSNAPIGLYLKHGQSLPEHSGIIVDSNFIYNTDRFACEMNASNAIFRNNIIGPKTNGFRICEENGGPRGDSNTITNNLFYGSGLFLSAESVGARWTNVNHNVFLKRFDIYCYSSDPKNDSTLTDYNTYVNDTIVNFGNKYNLSSWQKLTGKDMNSIKKTISFNIAYPDTVREFYNSVFGTLKP